MSHGKPDKKVSKRRSSTYYPGASQTSPSMYGKWEGGKVELTVHISEGNRCSSVP